MIAATAMASGAPRIARAFATRRPRIRERRPSCMSDIASMMYATEWYYHHSVQIAGIPFGMCETHALRTKEKPNRRAGLALADRMFDDFRALTRSTNQDASLHEDEN